MKFSLVAVAVAFLCATVVSGAPSTPNVSFEELALSESFDFSGHLSEWGEKLRCIIDILDKELVDGLEDLWNKTKTDLDQLIDDWLKCSSNGTILDQIVCKTNVISKSVNILTTFINELQKVVGPIKLREIQKKIVNKCLKGHFLEEDASGDFDEIAAAPLPEQFQCIVNVLGDVSKANGLEELWSKSQPQFQLHIDNWRRCDNLENKVARVLCNIKEGAAVYRLLSEYFRLVGAEKPAALLEMVHKVQEKCTAYQAFEESYEIDDAIEFGIIGSTIEKLNCVLNATTEAVIGTEFAKPWEKLRKDIRTYIDNIFSCKDQPTDWQEAKCVVSNSTKAYHIVFNFIRNVRKLNRELYDNIKIQIKNKCFK